jgi:hypothetical protein
MSGTPESGVTADTVNVAFASRGGTAFAFDVLDGFNISALNDGSTAEWGDVYIAGGPTWTDDTFIGAAFDQSYKINRVAVFSVPGWGRPIHGYELQYTTVANPDETTPDDDWTTICPWMAITADTREV